MSENIKMTLEGAIAVTRFGLGARPGDIAQASLNPKTWLKSQLIEDNVYQFPNETLHTSQDYIIEKEAFFRARRNEPTDAGKLVVAKPFNKRFRASEEAEFKTRFSFGVQTATPFHERLVRFWSNHFSISGRTRDVLTAAAHEREAIRPAILGNFYDLALGAILHPAMLIYLENIRSIGENSIKGLVGRFRNRGLNENLAREALELHTVTPIAGYTQSDVTEFARALTGWTIHKKPQPLGKNEALFDAHSHEPGSRTIMGKTYFPLGEKQAKVIIRNLCHHPATAENIAKKVARHFCHDTPPETLVLRLQKSFLDTRGDLKSLYTVLIDSPELWESKANKLKTPDELLISAGRMIGERDVFPTWQADIYEGFGQTPFKAPTPEGWPDHGDAWLGPDAMLKRIEWANKLAFRQANKDAQMFLKHALGPIVSTNTAQAIEGAETRQQAFAMALMCPEFQRR